MNHPRGQTGPVYTGLVSGPHMVQRCDRHHGQRNPTKTIEQGAVP
ncbi:hypothetical protein [Ralstonia solanacearum]|nr:hypothetical protein [Ralstonia solanacearum]CBJ52059.1 hypothethical protein [Ralstonia solanacearum PSI07]